MRPNGTPHLYEPSMVPNLLPFSASVTIGGGSTQNTAAIPQGRPGFAAMLGLGATPVTQGSPSAAFPGSPVTVSIMPPSATPLLGLTDGALAQPVEAALPEMLNIAGSALGTDTLTDAAPQPDTGLVIPVAAPAPAPAPIAAPLPPATPTVIAPPLDPVTTALPRPGTAADPASAPEGGTVTLVEGPRKVTDPAPIPTETTATVVDAPDTPAPPVKPIPAPITHGGTITTVDSPREAIATAPEGSAATIIAPPRQPVDPESGPQGGSVTIVEPPSKPAIPAPAPSPQGGSEPIAQPVRTLLDATPAPSPDSSTATVVDGPDKELDPVPATPTVPTDAAHVPVPVLTDPAAPVIAAAIEPSTPAPLEDVPAPQTSSITIAATSLAMPAPATPNPTPPQPGADAPSAPVAAPRPAETMQPTEPVASGIAIDAPVDDGAFDTLVTAEPASSAEALRASGEAASDAMNREGNRQSAQQPQPPAPAPTSVAVGATPAFDPLAAPAPAAAPTASDTAAEPRARASAIGEDVGLAIVRHADTGSGDVLIIRLDPAELGKIEVRLRMDEARQLSAEVSADQPATLDLLRRDADNLTRALNDAGFRADDQSLRFDSRGFGQNDQQAQQGRRVVSRAYLPEDDAAASSIPSPVQVRSSGRVDLVA